MQENQEILVLNTV